MSKPRSAGKAPLLPRRLSARTVQAHLHRIQQQLDGFLIEVIALRQSLVLPAVEDRQKQLDETAPVSLEVALAGLSRLLEWALNDAESIAAEAANWWTPARLRQAWRESEQSRPFSAAERKRVRKAILEHRNPGDSQG